MDISELTRASEPGEYRVTTRRGEVIDVRLSEDAGIEARWVIANPKRRPLPHLAFTEWNSVYDIVFTVGQWSGVQWTAGPVPYTPTSRVTQIVRLAPAQLDTEAVVSVNEP